MKTRTLAVQANVNTFSGFGQILCETVAQLTARGWDLALKPLKIDDSWGAVYNPVPLEILDLVNPDNGFEWELTLAPLDRPTVPTPGKRAIYWSMWEKEWLAPWQLQILNSAEAIIVPTEWQRSLWMKQIEKPIFVVPLGVNPTIFQPTPPVGGKCVFGAAGCLTASAKRKDLGMIVEAFKRLWAPKADIELRLKVLPGERVLGQFGKWPVTVNDNWMSCIDLARWFSGLTAFVNVGPEGWGLLAHQAAASARPVLAPFYGGVTGYLTMETSYPIGHKVRFGTMQASVDSLALEMQRVYMDRTEAAEKGVMAAKLAGRWTWENSTDRLEDAIETIINDL